MHQAITDYIELVTTYLLPTRRTIPVLGLYLAPANSIIFALARSDSTRSSSLNWIQKKTIILRLEFARPHVPCPSPTPSRINQVTVVVPRMGGVWFVVCKTNCMNCIENCIHKVNNWGSSSPHISYLSHTQLYAHDCVPGEYTPRLAAAHCEASHSFFSTES